MRPIKKGTTDVSVIVRVIDDTDGTPETGVAYNTSGVDLWYRRDGAAAVDITEATLAGVDSAHSDGGFIHINDGYCRLDLPDAACATGVDGVMVGGTFTDMIVIGTYVPLVNYDPYDGVRMGMTALPNAAADAAGGLPISDDGELDLDTQLAATNEITAARMGALTDWINDGRLDAILDAIKAKTDSLTFTVAGDVDCNVQTWKGAAASDMTGDAFARLGAPAGASVSADVAAVKSETASILEDTGTTLDGLIKDVPTVAEFEARTIAAADYTVVADLGTVQTGDSFAIVNGASGLVAIDGKVDDILTDTGTTLQGELDAIQAAVITNAAGADIAADIIALKAETASILEDTGTTLQAELDGIQADTEDIQTQIGVAGAGLSAVPWNAAWDAEVQSEVEDALGNSSIGSLSMGLVSLIEGTYQMTNNKMTVNESTGAVALRNIGDTATIATGEVVSSSGTTTRDELSWV